MEKTILFRFHFVRLSSHNKQAILQLIIIRNFTVLNCNRTLWSSNYKAWIIYHWAAKKCKIKLSIHRHFKTTFLDKNSNRNLIRWSVLKLEGTFVIISITRWFCYTRLDCQWEYPVILGKVETMISVAYYDRNLLCFFCILLLSLQL